MKREEELSLSKDRIYKYVNYRERYKLKISGMSK